MLYTNFITYRSYDYISDVEVAVMDIIRGDILINLMCKYDAYNNFNYMCMNSTPEHIIDVCGNSICRYIPYNILRILCEREIYIPNILYYIPRTNKYIDIIKSTAKIIDNGFIELAHYAPMQVSLITFQFILQNSILIMDYAKIIGYISFNHKFIDYELYLQHMEYLFKYLHNNDIVNIYNRIRTYVYNTSDENVIAHYENARN